MVVDCGAVVDGTDWWRDLEGAAVCVWGLVWVLGFFFRKPFPFFFFCIGFADTILVVSGLFVWSSMLLDKRYSGIRLPLSVSARDVVDGEERQEA